MYKPPNKDANFNNSVIDSKFNHDDDEFEVAIADIASEQLICDKFGKLRTNYDPWRLIDEDLRKD